MGSKGVGVSVDWTQVQQEFLLPRERIYLNGATFSALPRPVFEAQVRHMREAEADPTRIAAWRGEGPEFYETQKRMAAYLGCNPEDMVFHTNVTQALNQAFFSLAWPAGGEMLASDGEYGAIVNAARAAAERSHMTFRTFKLVRQPSSAQEIIDGVVNALSDKTAGLLLSHVISGNGLVTPVAELARQLARRNVRFIVDGAHGPGLLPLRLGDTEIDLYGGNLHKWFMGPKGTAFLYAKRSLHRQMKPHIVGWSGDKFESCARAQHGKLGTTYAFPYLFGCQGLRDTSPIFALTAALDFRERIGEENIMARLRELALYTRNTLSGVPGYTCISPEPGLHAGPLMFEAPAGVSSADVLTQLLFDKYGITLLGTGRSKPMIRISAHIWNSEDQIDRLACALRNP